MEITLFGHFVAVGNEDANTLMRRPRAQLLMSYLILSSRAVTRAELATALWPDTSSKQARTNLRRELHSLQKNHLKKQIESNGQTLQWKQSSDTTVDYETFLTHSEELRNINSDSELAKKGLLISNLYGGPLLVEFEDEWLTPYRDRANKLWIDAAKRLAGALINEAQHTEAETLLKRVLNENPVEEWAVAELLRLMMLGNRTIECIEYYDSYRALLLGEYGTTPSESLIHVYTDLTAAVDEKHTNHENTEINTRKTSSKPRSMVFEGREIYTARVIDLLHATNNTESCVISISGEAGIGKTALLQQALNQHYGNKTTPGIVKCQVNDSSTSYTTLTQILSIYESEIRFDQLKDHHKRQLISVFPDVFSSRCFSVAQDSENPRSQQLLYDAVRHALSTAVKTRLIVIDDLQWIDNDSLAFLQYCLNPARDGEQQTTFNILCTTRASEVLDNPFLEKLILNLSAQSRYLELPLYGLNESNCRKCIQAWQNVGFDLKISNKIFNKIYRLSKGNPLFLFELFLQNDPASTSPQTLNVLSSDRLHSVISARLAKLSNHEQTLARIFAVMGQNSPAEIAFSACDMERPLAMDTLDLLLKRNILVEKSKDNFEFSHDCIRESILIKMTRVRVQFIHQRLAIAYTNYSQFTVDKFTSQIAFHYDNAGMLRDAAEWYEAAADLANKRYAYYESLACYTKAVSYMPEFQSDSTAVKKKGLMLLQIASVSGYLYGFSSRSVKRTCDELRCIMPDIEDMDVRHHIYGQLRSFAFFTGNIKEALALAKAGLEVAKSSNNIPNQIEAYRSVALCQSQLGRLATAERLLKSAIAKGRSYLAEQNDVLGSEMWSFLMSGYICCHVLSCRGKIEQAYDLLNRSDVYSQSNMQPDQRIHLHLARLFTAYYLRDKNIAAPSYSEIRSQYEITKMKKAHSIWLAFEGYFDSDTTRGIAKIHKAIELYNQLNELNFTPYWYCMLAERQLEVEDLYAAEESITNAISTSKSSTTKIIESESHRLHALYLLKSKNSLKSVEKALNKGEVLSKKHGARLFLHRNMLLRLNAYTELQTPTAHVQINTLKTLILEIESLVNDNSWVACKVETEAALAKAKFKLKGVTPPINAKTVT